MGWLSLHDVLSQAERDDTENAAERISRGGWMSDAAAAQCSREGCTREPGHVGRHNHQTNAVKIVERVHDAIAAETLKQPVYDARELSCHHVVVLDADGKVIHSDDHVEVVTDRRSND